MANTSSPHASIMTLKEVADYLKVNERTIYRMSSAGKLPAFKVGGIWRFTREDIENWIRQQTGRAVVHSSVDA